MFKEHLFKFSKDHSVFNTLQNGILTKCFSGFGFNISLPDQIIIINFQSTSTKNKATRLHIRTRMISKQTVEHFHFRL